MDFILTTFTVLYCIIKIGSRRNPIKNPGNPNKKKFLFGLSTQKLENPGNPNKKPGNPNKNPGNPNNKY
jgi:hypothetical protein